MKELKDLIAGDYVLVVGRSCRCIAKIDKVTKTQIIANNARFRRDSGWQYGGDSWNGIFAGWLKNISSSLG